MLLLKMNVESMFKKKFHSFLKSFLNSRVKRGHSILNKKEFKKKQSKSYFHSPHHITKQLMKVKNKLKKRKKNQKLYLEDQYWIHAQEEFSQFVQNLYSQLCEKQSFHS